jgi:hypothetical protein
MRYFNLINNTELASLYSCQLSELSSQFSFLALTNGIRYFNKLGFCSIKDACITLVFLLTKRQQNLLYFALKKLTQRTKNGVTLSTYIQTQLKTKSTNTAFHGCILHQSGFES